MPLDEKLYDAECIDCGDRNYRELKSYINGLTHYSWHDGRRYIDKQNIEWKIKQIEAQISKCTCECPLCNKCDNKEGDE